MTPGGTAHLTERGTARVLRGHPWVFRSDVRRVDGGAPGGIVSVAGAGGRVLGFAFHSTLSEIRLRMIERGEDLSPTWLRDRLETAIRWRETVAPGARACRLVHGEGDRLPSLIVDRYGDHLVVQTLSQATEALKEAVASALVELLAPEGILERNDPKVRGLEGLEPRVGLLHGSVPGEVEVDEGGVLFIVDPWKGQKTGLFLDQRENHEAARSYARGRVLDGFCYDGGFALGVARSAEEVVGVDISGDALSRLRRNASRNGLANVQVRDANVFDVLRELDARGETFDTVILDPPAFAKSKGAVAKARRGYKEINLRALKVLAPGGCLVTCSCSYHVHEADFRDLLHDAAVDAGATVVLVEQRRQARDHPIVLGVPETSYLKCFVLRKLA